MAKVKGKEAEIASTIQMETMKKEGKLSKKKACSIKQHTNATSSPMQDNIGKKIFLDSWIHFCNPNDI
jgi:hypothetical protein